MSNLTKLEFVALDLSGDNYLSWYLDAEIHLDAKNLGDTIKEGNTTSIQDRAKAMIFIRHHLDEGLKAEYLTVKDPRELWQNLKERFDHHKTVILPKARYNWSHLRLQDFKSVSEYNSAVFKISSQLNLCGHKIGDEEMLEKTFSTFHASNMLLQQQYRERGFKKYHELISCLLVAEQNNKLLMKNHQSRPTGSEAYPEMNAISAPNYGYNRNRGPARGRGNNRGRGRGQGQNYPRFNGGYQNSKIKKPEIQGKRDFYNESIKNPDQSCTRCGMNGHWERTCRIPKHLVDLYQASLRQKNVESNNVEHPNSPPLDITAIDCSDFFEEPSGDISHLIGDGTVRRD